MQRDLSCHQDKTSPLSLPLPPGEALPRVDKYTGDVTPIGNGTAIVGFWVTDYTVAPIMRIDTETGEGTVIGYSELGYNHGGDTMPTSVRVAHLNRRGQYRCTTIDLSALPAHLAHGDYVPGTDGHSCECP